MAMSAIANKLSGSVDTSSNTAAAERPSFIFNRVNNVTDAGGASSTRLWKVLSWFNGNKRGSYIRDHMMQNKNNKE